MNDRSSLLPRTKPEHRDHAHAACPHLHSETLFAGGKLVVILHAGREYQLRVTAGNKLILTA